MEEQVCNCIPFTEELGEIGGIIYNEKLALESPCLQVAGTNITLSKGIIGTLNEEQRRKYCPSIKEIEVSKIRERIEKLREVMKRKG